MQNKMSQSNDLSKEDNNISNDKVSRRSEHDDPSFGAETKHVKNKHSMSFCGGRFGHQEGIFSYIL